MLNSEDEMMAYVAHVQAIVVRIQRWMDDAPRYPKFTLPSKEVLFAAPLIPSVVKVIARNDDALEVCKMCHEAVTVGGGPTVLMLDVALQDLGIEVERVAFEKLGLKLRRA